MLFWFIGICTAPDAITVTVPSLIEALDAETQQKRTNGAAWAALGEAYLRAYAGEEYVSVYRSHPTVIVAPCACGGTGVDFSTKPSPNNPVLRAAVRALYLAVAFLGKDRRVLSLTLARALELNGQLDEAVIAYRRVFNAPTLGWGEPAFRAGQRLVYLAPQSNEARAFSRTWPLVLPKLSEAELRALDD